MKTKTFFIKRLEKSEVLKRIGYKVSAKNKSAAIKKLNKMQYDSRDTIDEIQEDNWAPQKIIDIIEEKE